MTFNQLVYTMVRPIGGLRVARYLSRRHPRILMYHRINGGVGVDGLSIDVFREQLRIIKNDFHPMALDELVAAGAQGSLPDNAVALTFDDGYRDFYEYAFPLLQEMGLPATLFVTTGFVSGSLWLWPDQLKYILENTVQKYLSLPELEAPLETAAQRHHAWNTLGDICLVVTNAEKMALIKRLARSLRVELPDSSPESYRGLTWSMVKEMSDRGLDIGSHSVSHPILTQVTDSELDRELTESRKKIEGEIGRPVHSFCYPNGQESDFDKRTRQAVINAGYQYALAAYSSPAPLQDPWAIGRYAGTANMAGFEKSLYGFTFLGNR